MNGTETERPATPLDRLIAERVRREGPLPVEAYMALCLGHPEHGYYVTREAIGASGDFVTAPEISQVFGELLGLWSLVVWQSMGSPKGVALVEIGPGRGTLMADMLRVLARHDAIYNTLRVELIEPSPRLACEQRKRLEGRHPRIAWHVDITAVPPGPAIVIANEVLDALPVRQCVRTADGWAERAVGLDEQDRLCFTTLCSSPHHGSNPPPADAQPGMIVETRDTHAVTAALARAAEAGPLAALFADYGYASAHAGDTLQAVRRHRYEDPLASPGEADLTAHVDFAAFAREAERAGLAVDGPVPQAVLLGRLGIVERTSRLMAANPLRAGSIEAATQRLMAPGGMGTRFLALGVRSAGLPRLPGLD